MLIRMDDMNIGKDVDPFSRLENLVQKARARAAAPQQQEKAEAAQEPSPAELDFSDPRAREHFLGSLHSMGAGPQPAQNAAETHQGLDPERVAALLDFD